MKSNLETKNTIEKKIELNENNYTFGNKISKA
jgi:hypothetical protein